MAYKLRAALCPAVLVCLLVSPLHASDNPGGKGKNGLVVVPFVFYTPETGLAGGLPLIYYYRTAGTPDRSRPNSINLLMFYTGKQQSVFQLVFDHYMRGGEYRLMGGPSYSDYPNKFFGIGNDTPKSAEEDYTSRYAKLEMKFLRRMLPRLYAGIQVEAERNRVIEPEAGGLLERGLVTGSGGGDFAGVGLLAVWDSRDNVFCPTVGAYHQISIKEFSRGLGSDFDFQNYIIDLRKYFGLFDSHTLALQGYGEFLTGDPPFNRLARIGGPVLMRGYFQGRFRDRNMLIAQSEYRMPLWKRIGVAGVVAAGEVADEIGNFTTDGIKYSYGLGLRFLLDPGEKINLRLDFDRGEGDSGIYLVFLEAF